MTEAVPIGRMSMSTQTDTNKDLIRRAFACMNRADFDAAGECIAADLERNGQAKGREGDRIRVFWLGRASRSPPPAGNWTYGVSRSTGCRTARSRRSGSAST